jgi:hypothetical protein
MAKYVLAATEPRMDGSGEIAWDIWASDDEGEVLPSKHMTILTPSEDVATALAGPNVGAKLIVVLKANLPEEGWDTEALDEAVLEYIAFKAANVRAAEVDSNLDTFIGTAGGYPIEFDA